MDNLHYRRNIVPGKSRQKDRNSLSKEIKFDRKYCKVYTENIVLQIFFIFILRVEIVTISKPKVVTMSARHTVMIKFANFVKLYFPHIFPQLHLSTKF